MAGFFGFGGEKYSKDAYDKAEEERKIMNERTPGAGEFSSEAAFQSRLEEDNKNRENANKKVEKLFEAGRKEATQINIEYDKKIDNFKNAYHDLYRFMKDQLEIDETTDNGQTSDIHKKIKEILLAEFSKYWAPS